MQCEESSGQFLLDIQGEREEDPDGRTDDHREEQQDQLQAVPGPAQPASPELVQIRLNLHRTIYRSGLTLVLLLSYSRIRDHSLLVALDQHVQERHLPPVHGLQNLPWQVLYYKPSFRSSQVNYARQNCSLQNIEENRRNRSKSFCLRKSLIFF